MNRSMILAAVCLTACVGAPAMAEVQVSNYDDLEEGFLGTSFAYNGITYRDVNGVGGVFPDGSTFTPGDTGDQLIIENAQLLFNDFPGWGSPSNVMNFGSAFITGDNLTLGALSRVSMDLPEQATSASVDMSFYENGPWGGIVFHFQALLGGSVVDESSFVIAGDGTGRDNIAFNTLSVSAAAFDELRIFATFGDEYSAPRLIIDDLTIDTVPGPATLLAFAPALVALRRRR